MTGQKLGPRSSFVYCDQTESKIQVTCCHSRPDWMRDPGALLSTATRSNLGPTDSFVYYDRPKMGHRVPLSTTRLTLRPRGSFVWPDRNWNRGDTLSAATRLNLGPRGSLVCCVQTETGTQGFFCLLQQGRIWDPGALLITATRPNLESVVVSLAVQLLSSQPLNFQLYGG